MDLLAFLLAVLVVTTTPGPAMALVLRRSALQGRPAVATVLGLEAGLFAWAVLAGLGLAAVVAASETAYLVLRVVGAGVLLVLGVRALLAARRGAEVPVAGRPAHRPWRAFLEGLVVQLANPKAAVFVLALYTQFVPPGARVLVTVLLLALLQVVVETMLYLALSAAVARAGAWFRRSRVRRSLDAVSGTVLVGLGLRVAVTSR